LAFLQAAPFAHAGPVRQQAWRLAPQQVPFSQLPALHGVPLATQVPPVSQQAMSVAGPLHLLPAQQAFPAAPHTWQEPAAQTSFTPHVVPASKHVLLLMQQFPPVHALDAQHISVDPPHVEQLPLRQTLPAVLQLVSFATHVLSAGSQQAPAPVHAVPLRQHPRPLPPHGEHEPWKHTSLVPPHARPEPTHMLSVGSQQAVASVHEAPGQQALPVTPHGGASGGESFGASAGESTGESTGESFVESALES
jgi:hypothetical protein